MGDGCLMPFHIVVAGVTTFSLNPGAFQRVASEAESWAHFRVREFRFRIIASYQTTAGQSVTVGYCGGVQDAPPASLTGVSELIPSVSKMSSAAA